MAGSLNGTLDNVCLASSRWPKSCFPEEQSSRVFHSHRHIHRRATISPTVVCPHHGRARETALVETITVTWTTPNIGNPHGHDRATSEECIKFRRAKNGPESPSPRGFLRACIIVPKVSSLFPCVATNAYVASYSDPALGPLVRFLPNQASTQCYAILKAGCGSQIVMRGPSARGRNVCNFSLLVRHAEE